MRALSDDGISIEQFFKWVSDQDARFELVDGQVRMMAGSTNAHNDIKNNVEVALTLVARKAGCRASSSDSGIRTGERSLRLPDVVVNCGPRNPDAREIEAPTVVVEISSPGTRATDLGVKLAEYRNVASISVIIQIEPDVIAVAVHRRVGNGWFAEIYEDIDDVVAIPELAGVLTLRDIYLDMDVKTRPRFRIVSPA
jgi:Uma2 family endonuclease